MALMFDTDSRDWLDRALAVESPAVEVFFMTLADFYVGDPNDPKQLQDPSYRVPLAPPAIGAGDKYSLSTQEVLGNESALAAYYRDVVERGEAAGRSFGTSYDVHFWMRLSLSWAGGSLWFPWYDTWEEMTGLLNWLPLAGEDECWWDIDQGWEMMAVRRGAYFHIRQGDGDGNETLNLRLGRDPLLLSAKDVEARVVPIVAALSRELGADVWSRPTYGQDVQFGTEDWSPRNARRALRRKAARASAQGRPWWWPFG